MSANEVARKALPILFLLASLPGLVGVAGASAPENADVRAVYWVDQSIGTSYTANVMLTNMTADPISAWNMGFDLDPVAVGIRNAQWTVAGTRHQVTGAGWTSTIPVGGSVWFSIDGNAPADGVNNIPEPENCVFNGASCTFEALYPDPPNAHDTLAVDVGWWVASQGITQFRAQILLKNVTDIPVEHWWLRFRSTSLITNIEHGNWTRTGANYEVTGKGWTRGIDPEEMIWLTLTGVHTGQVDTLESCIFNGFPCEFVDPDDFVDAPEEPDSPGGLCSIVPADGAGSQTGSGDGIRIDWTPESFWADGYVYSLEISNDGDQPVRNWVLQFTLPTSMTISQMWNADWSRSGQTVEVRALPHNSCIEPGGFVQVGFEGGHDGLPEPPSECEFSGDNCTFLRATTVSVEDDEAGLSQPGQTFELEAAFPNPFATRTRIPFRVAETQDVHVTLWDLQGRNLGTLFRGLATAGQAYQIDVDAGTMPAGMYMVRLTGAAGSGVTTPVMLVR